MKRLGAWLNKDIETFSRKTQERYPDSTLAPIEQEVSNLV